MDTAEDILSCVWRFVAVDVSRKARERVGLLVEERILKIREHPGFSVDDAALFDPSAERRFGRMAHGFIAASDWLGANDWASEVQIDKMLGAVESSVRSWRHSARQDAGMAFHDETTAQRVIAFSALQSVYGNRMSVEMHELLSELVVEDVSRLKNPDFYAGLNNHGMFQDIGIIVASELVESVADPDELRALALSRMREYFSMCYTSDGVHIENTPTYHVMVSRYLSQVVGYANARGFHAQYSGLEGVLARAEEYAAHAVSPLGSFPPVSDTATMSLDRVGYRDIFPGRVFLGAASSGREGSPPRETIYVAEESGYAIRRDRWGSQESGYLFFSAAYNADYHKHSDELSVYFAHRGVEILREAGAYGYDWKDPFTRYAFSSAAHNTLIVDGEGLRRTDAHPGRTNLVDLGSTDSDLHVLGSTERYEGVRWSREVQSMPSEDGVDAHYVFVDAVRSKEERKLQFLWHFGPDVRAQVRGNVAEVFDASGVKLAELSWAGSPTASVTRVRGAKKPDMQGWAFPEMGRPVEADVLVVGLWGSDVDLTWTLRTSSFAIQDRGVNPKSKEWAQFPGEKPVTYLLDIPEEVPQTLKVVFSAIHQPGDFTFNYRSSLGGTHSACLYILDDFGDQGAYYLANGRERAEFRSVQALIRDTASKLGLTSGVVTTIGSSKGGAAALMHGLSIGAERIVAGAPQTRIGSFLRDPHPNILRYIAGSATRASVQWADDVVFQALKSAPSDVKIELLVGTADHHYRDHAMPFVNAAEAEGHKVQLLRLPGAPHSRIGISFREYLTSIVRQEIEGKSGESEIPHVTLIDPESFEFGVAVRLDRGESASFKLLRGREIVKMAPYSARGYAAWKLDRSGSYRCRVYVRDASGTTRAFGTVARPFDA